MLDSLPTIYLDFTFQTAMARFIRSRRASDLNRALSPSSRSTCNARRSAESRKGPNSTWFLPLVQPREPRHHSVDALTQTARRLRYRQCEGGSSMGAGPSVDLSQRHRQKARHFRWLRARARRTRTTAWRSTLESDIRDRAQAARSQSGCIARRELVALTPRGRDEPATINCTKHECLSARAR